MTAICPDRIGIVACVSRFLYDRNCNIIDSIQFGDPIDGRYFLRVVFSVHIKISLEELAHEFEAIAYEFSMQTEFFEQAKKTRTLILVSQFGHCLVDLLYRSSIGALPIEIVGVASNHSDFEPIANTHGIPFHHLPISKETKPAQEEEILKLIAWYHAELVVLARYMQILSAETCAKLRGRAINIHHSFLPSFKGARPYQQAHQRGVKLIGATAHYVTPDLDEGPIIEQAVERVSHTQSPQDYVALGRDIESIVLARAVKWHAEHRILLNGHRTVVLA